MAHAPGWAQAEALIEALRSGIAASRAKRRGLLLPGFAGVSVPSFVRLALEFVCAFVKPALVQMLWPGPPYWRR